MGQLSGFRQRRYCLVRVFDAQSIDEGPVFQLQSGHGRDGKNIERRNDPNNHYAKDAVAGGGVGVGGMGPGG